MFAVAVLLCCVCVGGNGRRDRCGMTQGNTEGSRIRLPKNSYTVYRLRYSEAHELYLSSRVVFLGKIPNVWLIDKKSALLNSIYRLRTVTKAKNLLAEEITARNFEAIVHQNGEIKLLNEKDQNDTAGVVTKPSNKLKSSLLNLKLEKETLKKSSTPKTMVSAPEIVIDLDTQKQKLSMISGDIIGNKSTFSAPRKSIVIENAEFCKLFDPDEDCDANCGASFGDVNLQRIDKSMFTDDQSKIISNEVKNGIPQSKTDLFVKNLPETVTNQPHQSLDNFMNKSLSEKQEILRTEINDAMVALHGHKALQSHEMDESSSEDTYYSACERLDTNHSFENVELTVPQNDKIMRSVKFLATEPTRPKLKSSTYLLASSNKVFQLNEQNPTPAALNNDIAKKEGDHSPETPFYIDDRIADTYKKLKSNSLASKYASTMETKVAERKKKLSMILQRFEEGEIIKIEKMLVMSYIRDKVGFDEHSGTKNAGKWKEYIVVVRATSDVDYPAIIQFYKTNKIFKKDALFSWKTALLEENLHAEVLKTELDVINSEINDLQDETLSFLGEENNIETTLPGAGNKRSSKNIKSKKSILSKLNSKADKKREKLHKLKNSHNTNTIYNDKKKFLKDNSPGMSSISTIVMSKYDTEVCFANLLDKSIQINKVKDSKVVSYIMLAHSTTSAMTWISFLQQLLDPKEDTLNKSLIINIPALDLSFDILGERSLLKLLRIFNCNVLSKRLQI